MTRGNLISENRSRWYLFSSLKKEGECAFDTSAEIVRGKVTLLKDGSLKEEDEFFEGEIEWWDPREIFSRKWSVSQKDNKNPQKEIFSWKEDESCEDSSCRRKKFVL